MTLKTEGLHAGHFIVSESNKTRSRETITIRAGEVLVAGAVLALIASGVDAGQYMAYGNDETSIGAAAAAILFDNVDATDGVVEAVALVRDCEVNGGEIVWNDLQDTADKDAGIADLLTKGIIVR